MESPPPVGSTDIDGSQIEGAQALSWLRTGRPENRLPPALAVLAAVALQYTLPDLYLLLPTWVLPALELVLLILLVALNPVRLARRSRTARWASVAVVALISADNTTSAGLLDYAIVTGKVGDSALPLLGSGAAIYLTNIIAFGIWYWELDRGGPFARTHGHKPHPDFLFPQMATRDVARPDWFPTFFDYLYVSFTNATAFSPTDTMPLSRWAKGLMAIQSTVALSTTALVVARAVNILK